MSLLNEGLRAQLGPEINAALADPDVVEVMVNPDGSIWTDAIGRGRTPTGKELSTKAADSALRLIASHANVNVNANNPLVSATLPGSGERFQGLYPPIVRRPSFAIRKKPAQIFPVSSYVERGALSAAAAETITQAVADKKNVLVAGGTGSGKTTFTNALLELPALQADRVALIEDVQELQCAAKDQINMLTRLKEPRIGMRDLVQTSLRLRPDRIIIGEVRDASALELLKAWNTGHPGGVATIHANSATDALHRLEDLIAEGTETVPYRAIVSAINIVVFLRRGEGPPKDDGKPQVSEIVSVDSRQANGEYQLTSLV